MSNQIVPNSVQAEEFLLGSILIAPEQILEISQIVSKSAFYIHRNRFIYGAMLNLHNNKTPIDYGTVSTELEKMGHLETIGGVSELTRLISLVPSSLHAVSYAKTVHEMSVRRAMLDASSQIAKLAYNNDVDIDTALSDMVSETKLVFDSSGLDNGFVWLADAVKKQRAKVEAIARGEIVRVPTGFNQLDQILNTGIANHQFVIVAGRPGSGKTSFMHKLVVNVAKNKRVDGAIALLSFEMDDIEVAERYFGQMGINTQHVASGRLLDKEYPIYTNAFDNAASLPIAIDERSNTIAKMRFQLSKLAVSHKISMIVVDYIQLMSGPGENRNLAISEISRNLKMFTKEFGCPVVAGSQLSRDIEKRKTKTPVLSDLRDSGSLEQDADIVIFIDRPEMYDASPQNMGMANFIVAKNRGGPIGTIPAVYRKQFTKFEEIKSRAM